MQMVLTNLDFSWTISGLKNIASSVRLCIQISLLHVVPAE